MGVKIKHIIKNKSKLAYRADETIFEGNTAKIDNVVNSIKSILDTNENYVALSAPQIGYNMRLFCMKFSDGEIRTFINPIITKHSDSAIASIESNPSLDGNYLTIRYKTVETSYQNQIACIESNAFTGYPGYIYQQMCESLDGVYLDDLGLVIDDDFYKATDDEKSAIVNALVKARTKKKKKLDREIKKDKDLKQLDDAVRFMTGVATGQIETVKIEDEKHTDN